MKAETKIGYISPELDVYKMIVEAPIASSLGAESNDICITDATYDDWGTL